MKIHILMLQAIMNYITNISNKITIIVKILKYNAMLFIIF
jgi:hypothetical protein